MALTVWKFHLDITTAQFVTMPVGARILSAANQGGSIALWALVDTEAALRADTEWREFAVFGTGGPIMDAPERLAFVGTVLLSDGRFVAHVFERLKP